MVQPEHVDQASPASSDDSTSTDAMVAIEGGAFKLGLIGMSSSAAFMIQMRNAVDGREAPELGFQGARAASSCVSTDRLQRKHEWKEELHSPKYALPPRSTADRLMEVYWQYSWVIFPVLDESDIRQCYEDLWKGKSSPSISQQILYCILNLAFAIACKLDPKTPVGEQEEISQVYFTRARDLLVVDLLSVSELGLVQGLLLMSQYLQSTNMPRQYFQTVGLAIWFAQDLGLHLPETALAIQDTDKRATAQRVWHSCIVMDRIAAMTVGRPLRIPQTLALRARVVADDPDTRSKCASRHTQAMPSRLRFFEANYHLHLILGDLLLQLYVRPTNQDMCPCNDGVSDRATTSQFDEAFQFERRLSDWHDNLEPCLKSTVPFDNSQDATTSQRQANILFARLSHIRILLWRPFFARSLLLPNTEDDESATSLGSSLERSVTVHCQVNLVRIAMQLVAHYHREVREQSSIGDSYWYSIYYIYTATTLLIAAAMSDSILKAISLHTLGEAVEQAFQCLRSYERFTSSARRCRQALDILQARIVSKISVSRSSADHHKAPSAASDLNNDFETAEASHVEQNLESAGLFDGMELFWLDSTMMNEDFVSWQ